jgi:hypothetical protein
MLRKSLLLIFLILVLLSTKTFPQNQHDSSKVQKINYLRFSFIAGVTLGGITAGHLIQYNLWWSGKRSGFHFNWHQDWVHDLGMDKFGHFYFPYLVTNVYSQLFEWSGIDEDKSLLYAGSFAMLYQTYVEIIDGFTANLGFSWGDFCADALGSIYPLLQEKNHVLKNFSFKISFEKSLSFKHHTHRIIFDDYESTYDWLSINIKNFLPGSIRKYYPSFINLAIGHSVKNLIFGKPYHEFYLGLDWNLNGLPGDFWLWKILKRNLNYYHFPAPTIRIYPDVVWFGFKF